MCFKEKVCIPALKMEGVTVWPLPSPGWPGEVSVM